MCCFLSSDFLDTAHKSISVHYLNRPAELELWISIVQMSIPNILRDLYLFFFRRFLSSLVVEARSKHQCAYRKHENALLVIIMHFLDSLTHYNRKMVHRERERRKILFWLFFVFDLFRREKRVKEDRKYVVFSLSLSHLLLNKTFQRQLNLFSFS